MKHVSYSELRQNLASYLDAAVETNTPISISREDGKGNVVLMSEAEFSSWQETAFLLGNPANAKHLLSSIKEADSGQLQICELVND